MTEAQHHQTTLTGARAAESVLPSGSPLRRFLIKVCLPLIVVASGGTGAFYVYNSRPDARQETPEDAARLVRVRSLERSTERVVVRAMGTVMAAREVALQPQVSGSIEKLSPKVIPGGRVKTDEVLFVIDSAEYQVALDRAEAELARAEAEQQSTTWELERLEGLEQHNAVNPKELDVARTAVRVSRANVAVARAAIDQARLNLERTTIRTPFNGIITEKNVDIGAQVSPGTRLATLVGTDEYWVKASIPVDRLRWIDIPIDIGETGSPVRVCQPGENASTTEWRGRVVRLLGDVETQGRMARALIAVKDPLGLNSSEKGACPLLIGAYVRAEIEGSELKGVFAIRRSALREGDRLWLMSSEAALVVKNVEVAWRDREKVLVRSGLDDGDQLVISDLATPVAGMALRVESSGPKALANSRDKLKDDTSGP